jgi:predicted RNA polymerase sigma factor
VLVGLVVCRRLRLWPQQRLPNGPADWLDASAKTDGG